MDLSMFCIHKPRFSKLSRNTQLTEGEVDFNAVVDSSALLQTELLAGHENAHIHTIIHIRTKGMGSSPTTGQC